MKKEELDKLLERYYGGETSEDEELALKLFFQGNIIPQEYKTEKELFTNYLLQGAVPEPSEGLEKRIIDRIDDFEKNRKTLTLRKIILYSLSTAAGLIIVAATYFFLDSNREPEDTFSDPKIAYAETMKILLKVSDKLNQGNQALEPLGKITKMKNMSFESINKSTRIIEKGMSSLNNINKAADISIETEKINK